MGLVYRALDEATGDTVAVKVLHPGQTGERFLREAGVLVDIGGFLGMGEDHHPLPWGALNYDTSLGGFVTDVLGVW